MKQESGMIITKERITFLENVSNELSNRLEAVISSIHDNTDETPKEDLLAQLTSLREIVDSIHEANCYDIRKSTHYLNNIARCNNRVAKITVEELDPMQIKGLFVDFLKAILAVQQQLLDDLERVTKYVNHAEAKGRDPQEYYDEVTADLEEPDTLDH